MMPLRVVDAFISDYYRNALQRPKMYLSSPEAFEDVVFVLEQLLDTLEGRDPLGVGSYVEFTVEQGCGSASFLDRYKLDRPGRKIPDEELHRVFGEFLRSYLASKGRDV